MQTAGDRRIGQKAGLAVINPPVLNDGRPLKIYVGRDGQRDAMLGQIDLVFRRIEFDFHDLM